MTSVRATLPVPLPPPVRPGDRVGVAALSSAVDPARLELGLAELTRLGFEPVPASNLASRDRLFAGDEAARLDGFHELVRDPSIRAIFFARGGQGVLRVLPGVDWEELAARPRAYVGYSDLTPLLSGIVERCGFATFHGPMVASDLARGATIAEEASLLGALAGEAAELDLGIVEGDARRVEGPLVGGCLSLISSVLGTPFAAAPGGTILFLEDVDEPLYRLDRMLTQLRLSGSLAAVQAMIFASSIAPGSVREWLDLARDAAPAATLAWGLSSGHLAPNLTLPLGCRGRLDRDARRLSIGGV
jgi:muramoyltetrapeptide carboxypeptidase